MPAGPGGLLGNSKVGDRAARPAHASPLTPGEVIARRDRRSDSGPYSTRPRPERQGPHRPAGIIVPHLGCPENRAGSPDIAKSRPAAGRIAVGEDGCGALGLGEAAAPLAAGLSGSARVESSIDRLSE